MMRRAVKLKKIKKTETYFFIKPFVNRSFNAYSENKQVFEN